MRNIGYKRMFEPSLLSYGGNVGERKKTAPESFWISIFRIRKFKQCKDLNAQEKFLSNF